MLSNFFSSLLRESIYRLLPQTTPENVSKNFSHYSVDPTTRYPNISLNFLKPSQVSVRKQITTILFFLSLLFIKKNYKVQSLFL